MSAQVKKIQSDLTALAQHFEKGLTLCRKAIRDLEQFSAPAPTGANDMEDEMIRKTYRRLHRIARKNPQ